MAGRHREEIRGSTLALNAIHKVIGGTIQRGVLLPRFEHARRDNSLVGDILRDDEHVTALLAPYEPNQSVSIPLRETWPMS